MFGDLILNHLENQEPIDGTWYLNDSKCWYYSKEQGKAYLEATEGDKKGYNFFSKEEELLEKHKKEIVESWPENTAVIDLGCGTASKTIIKLKEALNQEKSFKFYPLDVNSYLLTLAIRNSKKAGFIPKAHLDLIENFPSIFRELRKKHDSIYIHFGPNHVNFEKNFLEKIEKQMTKKDFLYLSAHQLRTEDNIEEIMAGYYNKKTEKMNFKVLELIGFEKKHLDYKVRFNKNIVECYFKIKEVPSYLKYLGMIPGHKIVVVTSRKPTLKEFKKQISIFNYKLYFSESKDFCIAVCKKK